MLFHRSKSKTTARRQGEVLVVFFESSEPSLVWRFDLEKNHSFALVLDHSENGWDLVVRTARNDSTPVAHFTLYDEAEAALLAVEKALMTCPRQPLFSGWTLGTVLKLVLLLGVIYLVAGFFFGNSNVTLPTAATSALTSSSATHTPVAPSATSAPDIKTGVPQSADSVLTPPGD